MRLRDKGTEFHLSAVGVPLIFPLLNGQKVPEPGVLLLCGKEIQRPFPEISVSCVMPGKKRKNLSKPAPDFVKKKRKVGKVKKSGEALTFKSKSVVVPSQLKVALGPTTHRKQNFQVSSFK